MTETEVLNAVIARLGDNYTAQDSSVLTELVNETIMDAYQISNREESSANLRLLCPEIIEASIIKYQQRGAEYVKSSSELGQSNTFVDVHDTLRNNIIKNSKRVIF